jgi:prepilin-type N-terminal cleavage/methylation domain-containing protein
MKRAYERVMRRAGEGAKRHADQGVKKGADQGVMRRQAGLTLMEVLIAVSLLSLLSVGMLIAMRVGLSAMAKANARLIDDRRVAGAQRIIEQEIAGFMPVKALCGGTDQQAPKASILFFQGEPQSMRFVSTYSLQQAWRGLPQILEFTVIPREDGKGVRLVVNEHVYSGPLSAGAFCLGPARFVPIEPGSGSFVLADNLAFCRFAYLAPAAPPMPAAQWIPNWMLPRWPLAVRIELAPFLDEAARLRPVTITQRIRITRSLEIEYVDQ